MRAVVGIASVVVIVLMLAEFFVTFLLPRRVKRDPLVVRSLLVGFWRPWRWLASRLSPVASDTMLGVVGPLSLLVVLGALGLGVIVGFAGLDWAIGSHLGGRGDASFADALYFSAGSFFGASTFLNPETAG